MGWKIINVRKYVYKAESKFGLSRFSASRGLDTLEGAGLVSVSKRTGLSPVVSIRDPTAGTGVDR
jgi:hypothetical protein